METKRNDNMCNFKIGACYKNTKYDPNSDSLRSVKYFIYWGENTFSPICDEEYVMNIKLEYDTWKNFVEVTNDEAFRNVNDVNMNDKNIRITNNKSMKNKIYIVTSGEYSDYHIDAVFSTEEKAEEYVQNNGSDYRIEDYELDKPIVNENKLWLISFNLEDGRIEDVTVSNSKKEYYCDTCKYAPYSFVKHLDFYVEAEVMDKARKIASERFAAVKANEYILIRLTRPYASTGYDKKYERFNVKTNKFIKE